MVKIDNVELLLARVGGNYYVTNNRCTHLGGRLVQGILEGPVVTCPLHGSQFDVRDGHVMRWIEEPPGTAKFIGKLHGMPTPLKVYKVTIRGDRIVAAI